MAPAATRRVVLAVVVAGLLVGAAFLALDPGLIGHTPESTDPDLPGAERATVAFVAPDGTVRGTLDARVADTARERYTGLSDTQQLGPDEGMLFLHESEGTYAYVMRDMAFPIDIVFVGSEGQVATIHHARVDEPPLRRYRGRGVWVVEMPFRWTTEHGVTVGDTVRIRDVER